MAITRSKPSEIHVFLLTINSIAQAEPLTVFDLMVGILLLGGILPSRAFPPYLSFLTVGRPAAEGRPGTWRLRILIQKDAFWTANLCHATARRYHPLVIAYPLVLLVLVVAVVTSGTATHAVLISRIVALAVALWLGREGLGAYLSFRRAAGQAESIDKALEDTPTGAALDAVLPALRDYDVVVAGLPSIPASVRGRERERLHRIWQNRVLEYLQ